MAEHESAPHANPVQYQDWHPDQQAPPRTNPWAVVSLIASLSSIFIGIGFIVGIPLGHYALREVRRTGEAGENYARGALITGYVFLGLWVAFFLALVVLMGTAITAVPDTFDI